MEIEDSKYEGLVSARSEAENKVAELTAALAEKDRQVETLEAQKVKAEEECQSLKQRADEAEEKQRVVAMKEERVNALGPGFRARLDKFEATKARVLRQAGEMSDEQWNERLAELEETLDAKRDAPLDDAKDGGKDGDKDKETVGTLFSRQQVQRSGLAGGTEEVVAGEGSGSPPSVVSRQSVMSGLIRPRQKSKA